MSRPIRFQGAGLIYHVMARGNNKMRIFLDDLDHARFLCILAAASERYEFDTWVRCEMPNHYHLVMRTRHPNLSLAIRQVNGCYAQWWNKRHAHVGHVYQGRFKAQVIEASTYLVRLCRYVLMNPVRSGLAAIPADWPWSSYRALAGLEETGVDVSSLLTAIDPDRGLSRSRLLQFVDGYADDEMAALVRRDERIIGSAPFARQFAAQARTASSEVPKRERRIGTPPLVELLAKGLSGGGGFETGIRDAFAASYSVPEIASCAGLSRRTVARILDVDLRRRTA